MEEENTGVEPQEEETTQNDSGSSTEFTLDSALAEIKKLRREAAENRVKARENQEKATQFEQRLNSVTTEFSEFKTSTEAEKKQLNIKLQLTGAVVDPDKAAKLIEDSHFKEDGSFDAEKFLADNPFLANNQKQITNPVDASDSDPNKEIDLSTKDRTWLIQNWDKLRRQ